MTRGLEQQNTGYGYALPKSAPTPQHGQKAPLSPLPAASPRSYKPRPGH